MAKKKKAGKLTTLPADLSSLAGQPMAVVKARVQEAIQSAQSSFDTQTAEKFVFSGRDAAPLGAVVLQSSDGVTIRLRVSPAAVPLTVLQVSPDLSVDTTGARRKPVRVTGVKGRTIEVPRGFIWNTLIFQRQGKTFVYAKSFLVKALADPSPAYALGKSSGAVAESAINALMGALDDAGENRK